MQQVIYTLLNYINNSISKDTNYHIALKILEHIQEIDKCSLEKVAQLCIVSPATINRFCKQIGYMNYSTLRNMVSVKERQVFSENDFDYDYMREYTMMIQTTVNEIHNIDLACLDRALAAIYQQKRCLALGYGSYQNYVLDLQKNLFSCGKFIEVYMDSARQFKEAQTLTQQDVIIMSSLQGHFIDVNTDARFDWVKLFKRIKCKTILITQIEDSEILEAFDYVICCGSSKYPQTSKYALIRLYDLISSRYRELYHPVVME